MRDQSVGGFKNRISRLWVCFVAVVVLHGFSAKANAQFAGPPQQMYAPGTGWQKTTNADGSCLFAGRQPQGSTVYAWPQGCTDQINAWGYALDYPSKIDAVVWVNNTQACGIYSRAWQWYDNGSYAEYVGVRNGCTFDYYSGSNVVIEVPRWGQKPLQIRPALGCGPNYIALNLRKDNTYSYLRQVLMVTNPNMLQVEKAWHAYNRAFQTFSTCQRQLVPKGPGDYHRLVP